MIFITFTAVTLAVRFTFLFGLRSKIESLVLANQMMMHYQGMSFDLTGLGPFLSFNIEKTGEYEIVRLKIIDGKNVFERNYHKRSYLSFKEAELFLSINEVQLNITVRFSQSSLFFLGLWIFFINFSILLFIWLIRVLIENKNARELEYLAKQVAHDIRSPLAALDLAMTDLDVIDERRKTLIKSAYRRINDIANNLLTKNSSEKREVRKPFLLQDLMLSIVSEKRLFIGNKNIEIRTNLDNLRDEFANINRVELERIISNLVNNSIEAFNDEGGLIEIFSKVDTNVTLSICDNGPGIPSDILKDLGKKGVSTKTQSNLGRGLGLFHAMNTVRSWGGDVHITSSREGTNVTVTFPACEAPSWFKKNICLTHDTLIVVLDDDRSIHEFWKEKFKDTPFKMLSFTTSDNFKKWYAINKSTIRVFLLCDFECGEENGIDIILESGLVESSLLVSGRLNESSITDLCERHGISGLPKLTANLLTVELAPSEEKKADFVLIDDEKLTHLIWSAAAKKNNLKMIGVESVEMFLEKYQDLDRNIPIFIDSRLGNDVKGEIVSRKIFERNFTNLYLATAYEAKDIDRPEWIKEVFGKDPEVLKRIK